MSRRLILEESNHILLKEEVIKELRLPELKYIQSRLIEYYRLYPEIYNFRVRNDDRDLHGRLRKDIQSIVVYYCLERDNNYFNLTVDIDFSKVCCLKDITKRIILEIDNSLVRKGYRLREFQYKYYKEPLFIGKKFIKKEEVSNIFYKSI